MLNQTPKFSNNNISLVSASDNRLHLQSSKKINYSDFKSIGIYDPLQIQQENQSFYVEERPLDLEIQGDHVKKIQRLARHYLLKQCRRKAFQIESLTALNKNDVASQTDPLMISIKKDVDTQTVTEFEVFNNQDCKNLARLPLENYDHICSFLKLQSLERLSRVSQLLNFIVRPKLLMLKQFEASLGCTLNKGIVSSLLLTGKYENDYLYYEHHYALDTINLLAIIIKHKKLLGYVSTRNKPSILSLTNSKSLHRHGIGSSTHSNKELQTDLYTGSDKIIAHNVRYENIPSNIISHNLCLLEHPNIFFLFNQFSPDPICTHRFATHIQALYRGFRVRQLLLKLNSQKKECFCNIS